MPNCRGPISLSSKVFRSSAMLGRAELAAIEQLKVAAAMGAYGAPCDADSNHYGDNEQAEQHADGEPAARYRGAFFQQAVEQLVDPLLKPLGRRLLGVD